MRQLLLIDEKKNSIFTNWDLYPFQLRSIVNLLVLFPSAFFRRMSVTAIDFYCSVDKAKGVDGKDRVAAKFEREGSALP